MVRNPYGHIMNEAEMKELVPGFDAIILGSDTLNRNVLACADQLKIISRYGVGLDNIDLEYAKEKNIKVTVTAHSNTEAVADYAVGLMLAVLRKICLVHMRLEHGNWQKRRAWIFVIRLSELLVWDLLVKKWPSVFLDLGVQY